MKLIDQVCSFELSKRLKELGVKQDSLFYWHHDNVKDYPSYGDPKLCLCSYDNISAFSVAELGEMLPDSIKDDDSEICWFYHDKNNCHRISYVHECEEQCSPFIEVKGETEANARAKMLIHLIENKHIEVPK